jgi:hypothetical protein
VRYLIYYLKFWWQASSSKSKWMPHLFSQKKKKTIPIDRERERERKIFIYVKWAHGISPQPSWAYNSHHCINNKHGAPQIHKHKKHT